MATITSFAQVQGLMRDRFRRALDEKIEKEISKPAEEKETETEGSRPPSAFEKKMEESMLRAMGFAELDFEEQYSFSSEMVMDMVNYDANENKESGMLYTIFFDDSHESFAMRFSAENDETGDIEQTLLIYDMKNHVMLMLSDTEDKNGMAFSLEPGSSYSETTDENHDRESANRYENEMEGDPGMIYGKTGRSKTISGFRCEEYAWEDENHKAGYWWSSDAGFDYSPAYGYMGPLAGLKSGSTAKGMVMEYNFTDKETGSWSKMEVKEINTGSNNTFDVSGYSVIGFKGSPEYN